MKPSRTLRDSINQRLVGMPTEMIEHIFKQLSTTGAYGEFVENIITEVVTLPSVKALLNDSINQRVSAIPAGPTKDMFEQLLATGAYDEIIEDIIEDMDVDKQPATRLPAPVLMPIPKPIQPKYDWEAHKPIERYRANLLQNFGKVNKVFVIAVDELLQAERHYADAIRLIPLWLQAIHSNDPQTFYDDLADLEVRTFKIPDNNENDELEVDDVSYNELCAVSKLAIDAMFKSLLLNYNICCLKDVMFDHVITKCTRIDSTTILLVITPVA